MKKGDILTVTIIDENHLGNGIAKKDDFTIFVPNTVKDEVVKIKVEKVNKKTIQASIIEFIKKENKKVKCPYYDKCGGCSLLHLNYQKENKLKEKYFNKLFKDSTKKIISFDRFNYRNKVTLHVKNKKIGFYSTKTNDLVEISNCLLLDKSINELLPSLQKCDLSKVKEITIKKGIEGVLISITGELSKENITNLTKNENITSLYINDKLVYGKKYIQNKYGNITYSINNNSFFQINNKCAEEMYKKIKDLVEFSDNLLDLYCGSATIGIYLSDICKNITGVEINKDSVKCAKENIKNNNINNYKIICDDAKNIKGDFDTIIVDPPRKGLSKEVIKYLNSSKCKKLIYVSCNPNTLKRDVELLNYELKSAQIFNMFPGTSHIESLMVLEKKDV